MLRWLRGIPNRWFGITLWHKTCVFSTIHSTKGAQGHVKNKSKGLLILGIINQTNDSDGVDLYFALSKANTNWVQLLGYLRNLNRQLKRKPYPMPKILDMLSKSEGFKYDISLDLNMSYYHISLSEYASKLCTTITPWGNYRYQILPMGVRNPPELFQEKANKIFHVFEFIWAYIKNLLIITKSVWSYHQKKFNWCKKT